MSLANLTLKGMDRYGAIELRQNADKFVTRGFLTAVGMFIALFLLSFVISAITKEDEKKIPKLRIKSLAELAPPPSTQDEVAEPMAVAPPTMDVAKPTFGIPVPVPDAVAPQAVMPDLNDLPVSTTIGEGTGTGVVLEGTGNAPVEIKAPVQVEEEPDPEEFISVDVEPQPIQNLQSLVTYPEVAKRSGLEGKVIISALIDVDGKVLKTRIEKADYDVFKQPAIDALMKARFTPARQNGEPVKLWYTVPISFKLNER
jgi:protein TonB